MNRELTAERLRALLHYDPATGVWTWLVSRGGTAKAGTVAGSTNGDGYRQIYVDRTPHRCNRLAFLYMTGAWPVGLVDHEDTDKSNEKWHNLRDATKSQNNSNVGLRRDNRTGFKGVSIHACGKYWARIRKDKKLHSLGLYDTAENASAAYQAAAEIHHGEFARAF